jgi:hypothetical protein
MPNHAASAGRLVFAEPVGKVKWNVAPSPPLPAAQIRPPCDSTIDLLIARPMPLPSGFVKNASNIWSALSMGSPGPVSFRDLDLAVLTRLRLHRKHAARILHRLDTIEHEVHQYLLNLHSTRHGRGKITFPMGAELHAVSSGCSSQHVGHFSDDFIDRDQLSPSLCAPQLDWAGRVERMYPGRGERTGPTVDGAYSDALWSSESAETRSAETSDLPKIMWLNIPQAGWLQPPRHPDPPPMWPTRWKACL